MFPKSIFKGVISLWLILVFLVVCGIAAAEPKFPALTGRVVDEAGILSALTKQDLTALLQDHEQKFSNQVVVVTLNSLQGHTIEEFGYNLGRSWGIGQKSKNNGLLIIVAPNERETRIEVGYGLEGQMPDATASAIIQTIMIPKFKSGDMELGIKEGTVAILSILEGKQAANVLDKAKIEDESPMQMIVSLVILLTFGFLFYYLKKLGCFMSKTPPFRNKKSADNAWMYHPGNGGYYPMGGSSDSNGFSGGGGSFGGGGSSGKW